NVTEGYLDGQMLLAMPGVTDKTFARSIVLVCAHSSSGAMGIVVNRRAENSDFQALLVQLKVISPDEAGSIPIGLAETPVAGGGRGGRGSGWRRGGSWWGGRWNRTAASCCIRRTA